MGSRRAMAGLGVTVLAAGIIGAAVSQEAAAHTNRVASHVNFVAASDPGDHAVRVRSAEAKCVRDRHVTWYREGGARDVVVFAGDTGDTGIAEPQQPFPAESGDYAVASKKTIRSGGGHRHVCREQRSPTFAPPAG